jgi:two-component system KDP operon response regulator KdpE
VKILVAEDDAEIVEFVSIAFDVGWPETEMVSTHQGGEVAELVENEAPDLLLLDLGLPDVSGFDVLRQVRQFSTMPIIVVTVRDNEADIVKGLEWGADEYVVKPFGQLELLARVKAVLRSRRYSQGSDGPVVYGPLQFDPSSGQLTCGSGKAYLTRTESLIFHLLVNSVGHVVTHSKLADAVWGDEYPQSTDTLRVHVRRLRAKLRFEQREPVRIRSIPGTGYTLEAYDRGTPIEDTASQ